MALTKEVKSAIVKEYQRDRSEEHTSELQSRFELVCRLLLEKKKKYVFMYRSEEHISLIDRDYSKTEHAQIS